MGDESYIGKKFNMLTILEEVEPYVCKSGRDRQFLCLCDCGNTHKVRLSYLKYGKVKSCGCYARSLRTAGLLHKKHGGRYERLYHIWKTMRSRCNTPTCERYKNYGGRGISICSEWNDYETFRLWAHSNGYREDLTIDRIDVNGNYEPSNCKWSTLAEQANNRTTTHWMNDGGKKVSMADYCRNHSLNYKHFHFLVTHGTDIDTAIKKATA